MNKPENHKYRICLNLIISDKETTFYDKSFITLVSAYLIDKEQNPMNLIREELNEYKAAIADINMLIVSFILRLKPKCEKQIQDILFH